MAMVPQTTHLEQVVIACTGRLRGAVDSAFALQRHRLNGIVTVQMPSVPISLAPLTEHAHRLHRRFAADVAEAGRRTVTEALDLSAKHAELNQLLGDWKRREDQESKYEEPLIVRLDVRFA